MGRIFLTSQAISNRQQHHTTSSPHSAMATGTLDVSGSLPHARAAVSTGVVSLLHQSAAEQKRPPQNVCLQRKQPKADRSASLIRWRSWKPSLAASPPPPRVSTTCSTSRWRQVVHPQRHAPREHWHGHCHQPRPPLRAGPPQRPRPRWRRRERAVPTGKAPRALTWLGRCLCPGAAPWRWRTPGRREGLPRAVQGGRCGSAAAVGYAPRGAGAPRWRASPGCASRVARPHVPPLVQHSRSRASTPAPTKPSIPVRARSRAALPPTPARRDRARGSRATLPLSREPQLAVETQMGIRLGLKLSRFIHRDQTILTIFDGKWDSGK
jgi:hypothetical protein